MITDEIRELLFSMQDIKYRDFQAKLIPGMNTEKKGISVRPAHEMIGVRTPELRKMAKQMMYREDLGEYLQDLPHRYFDENQLHAFIISEIKDFDKCVEELESFLPFVDNWATCDQLSPKAFKNRHDELLPLILGWIASDRAYTIRFGIGMLMRYYLDDEFKPEYLELAADVRSDEYYVNMMRAWFFATALAKQYQAALPYFTEKRLDVWTHNKAIQKSVESFRISPGQKEFLKSLKLK